MARARALLATAIVIAAAGSVVTGCKAASADPAPVPITSATFGEIQAEVLQPSCAFGSCHNGKNPAAGLGLAGRDVCMSLRDATSCVSPGKRLVAPGSSGDSFLVAKLTGQGLEATGGPCGGGSNRRMPYGGAPLTPHAIDLVRAWVDLGASCDSDQPRPEGEDDGGDGGDGGAPHDVTTAVAVMAAIIDVPSIAVGASAELRIQLVGPAPSGGEVVNLELDDPDAVGVSGALFIPAGATEATATIVGKRPSAAVNVRAVGGGAEATVRIAVTGLTLVELFLRGTDGSVDHRQWVKLRNDAGAAIDLAGYAIAGGRARSGESVLPLVGLLAPGACAVVGGPDSLEVNGSPSFTQAADFVPDLPIVEAAAAAGSAAGGAAGFALFAVGTDRALRGAPLDVVGVLVPGAPPSMLPGNADQTIPVADGVPAAGQSIVRGAGGWTRQAPQPDSCP